MRDLPFFLIIALASTTLATAQQTTSLETPTTSGGTFNHFYAPIQAYKVTIESEKGIVTVLEVPPGVFLNVQGYVNQNPSVRERTTDPRTFRGELVIRSRRADEREVGESRALHEIMAKSPLEMHLKNAVVVVEKR